MWHHCPLFHRILHQGGYTKEEQIAFKAIIYGNILQSAMALIRGMEMLGINYGAPAAQVCISDTYKYA